MQAADTAIKAFLYPRMYRHARILHVMHEAEAVVRDLFGHFVAHPPACRRNGSRAQRAERGRALPPLADYIAGMTDRYALVEHARYFADTPELR